MAVILKETEASPAAWPGVTPYPRASAFPDELDPTIANETVWRMLERWTTVRWPRRAVVFVVEGPGDWAPRLTPFAATATERWTGSAWESCALAPSPLGGFDLDEGVYRIAGEAGDDSPVPEDAAEAWRRLHSYLLGASEAHRATNLAYFSGEGGEAPRGWAARALSLSGAADLLRPYRRIA